MFHYRLTRFNKGSRMFIAACMAIALHLGIMSLEFPAKQVLVPNVTLPRSVSIILQKRSLMQPELHQQITEQNKSNIKDETIQTEEGQQLSVIREVPAQTESTAKSIHPPVVFKKTVLQPVEPVAKKNKKLSDDKVVPPYRVPGKNESKAKSENLASPKTQEASLQTEYHTGEEDEKAVMPGALQLAYPRYQLNTPPPYPGLARKRGQEGTVILQVLVNEKGRVEDLKVENSSGFGLLDRAAVSAVRNWNFEPGRQGDEKIAMWVRVPVTFNLKN